MCGDDRPVHPEITAELTNLPPQFFGEVLITYQAGLPTYIRITKGRKIEPKLPSVGVTSVPRDRK
jgi:hypothetical protein